MKITENFGFSTTFSSSTLVTATSSFLFCLKSSCSMSEKVQTVDLCVRNDVRLSIEWGLMVKKIFCFKVLYISLFFKGIFHSFHISNLNVCLFASFSLRNSFLTHYLTLLCFSDILFLLPYTLEITHAQFSLLASSFIASKVFTFTLKKKSLAQ